MAKAEREAVALAWLSNPIIMWGGAVLLMLLALRFLAPGLLGGIWDKVKGTASGALDSVFGFVGEITGSTGLSQAPDRQLTAPQKVGTLFVEGDRGLSDLLDTLKF